MNTKITAVLVQRLESGYVRGPFHHLVDPLDSAHHFIPASVEAGHFKNARIKLSKRLEAGESHL